jgi:alkyl hydroperoxide reductase subunit D
MLNLEKITIQLPESAKDIKLNLANVLSEDGATGLTSKQIANTALAVAYALKNTFLTEKLFIAVTDYLSETEINAAQAAATIMAMNNIYYRFVHLASNQDYSTMPARLRMNVLHNHNIEPIDFELSCFAVSVLNGCGACIDAHEQVLQKSGITKEGIQSAARIAAVLNAVSVALIIGI